jgi:hypothetical protein
MGKRTCSSISDGIVKEAISVWFSIGGFEVRLLSAMTRGKYNDREKVFKFKFDQPSTSWAAVCVEPAKYSWVLLSNNSSPHIPLAPVLSRPLEKLQMTFRSSTCTCLRVPRTSIRSSPSENEEMTSSSRTGTNTFVPIELFCSSPLENCELCILSRFGTDLPLRHLPTTLSVYPFQNV